MLTYTFTKRERALILALAVIVVFVAWYGLIFRGATEQIERMDAEIETTNATIELEEARLAQMKTMQTAIEAHKAAGTVLTEIPEYDNIKPLMAELDAIMRNTKKYALSFDALNTTSSDYVLRGVGMTVTCEDYFAAENIVRDIANGTYPCIVNSVSVSPSTSGGYLTIADIAGGKRDDSAIVVDVTLTVHVTFFEKPNQEMIDAKAAQQQ